MSHRHFLILQGILLVFSAIVLLVIFPIGGVIDRHLIQPWISHSGQFFVRDNWYLAILNHVIVKDLLTGVYVFFLVLWLCTFKIQRLKIYRWQYGYMFWVSMLSTNIVGLIKSQSAHACPWNMTHATTQGYIWDFSATHGHCFPGGHASAGFALMTGYFVYRSTQYSRAVFYLLAGILLGFAMGWAQMMRGAHFLSHNLWTWWIVWAINCVLYAWAHRYLETTTTSRDRVKF